MKIEVKKISKEELESLGTENWSPWGCDVSEFDWEYGDKETCYVKEGKVIVSTDSGDTEINGGDLVVFPAGLKCKWKVLEPIRKVYKFG